MESRAKLAGHAIHPMLVVFPLGLLATAFIFDLIHLGTGANQWTVISFWMIAAGIIGGLIAAPFGLADWLAIPQGTRARAIGATHGIGNLMVVILFAISWFLRRGHIAMPGAAPIVLAAIGVLVALYTGWLGGELVERLGVGVYPGANANASSSVSGRPADEPGVAEERLRRAG